MSLIKHLVNGSTLCVDTSQYDKNFTIVDESVMVAQEIALLEGIYSVDTAYKTADIIGCVKVVTEGVSPSVVMENIVKNAWTKLKEYWLKFYTAAKKFFLHVIDTVKAMFKDGGDFASAYGTKIKDKIKVVKEFKVTVWDYSNFSSGDAYIDKIVKQIADMCDKANNSLLAENPTFSQDLGGNDPENFKSESDFLEEFIGKVESGCDSAADLKKEAVNKYHNNSSNRESATWKSNDVDAALKILTDHSTTVKAIEKAWNVHETAIKKIITKLDKLGKKEETLDEKSVAGMSADEKSAAEESVKQKNNIYSAASHASKLESTLLTLGRQMISVKTDMHKERFKSYTAILKSFFAFKREKAATMDSMVFEGDEDLDFELNEGETLSENAISSADTPEGDQSDIGISLENYSNNNLLKNAMSLLG